MPAAISRHESHVPQGVIVGPEADWQFSDFARMRAVEVFPVPRGPTKM